MDKFEEIISKYGCNKRAESPLNTVDEIERFINFNLPSDYTKYIQNYSGFETQIGQEHVSLWDIDALIKMNKEYGITDNLLNTIAIGGNGSGEFIAIEFINEDQCRIVLSPFIDLDKQYHIEIGTSFTDFLVRLDNGQE